MDSNGTQGRGQAFASAASIPSTIDSSHATIEKPPRQLRTLHSATSSTSWHRFYPVKVRQKLRHHEVSLETLVEGGSYIDVHKGVAFCAP